MVGTVHPALQARGLVKAHGRGRAARRILDGACLDVASGEYVAILGRSGSGKSTLLHLLGGLDWPEAGTVKVGGERLDRASADRLRARRIGFVFQAFHLVPELTGRENVLLAGRAPGSSPETARRGEALITQLGLDAVGDGLPHELSGGEQQRFALARALAGDPDVVLADEPTGNLDAESATIVLDLLGEVARSGRAVVVVTHEAAARERADRVLGLRDGRLWA
jgi:ABC-type lipoprotein export system ATPase subunit